VQTIAAIGFSCSVDTGRWPKPGDVFEQWIENVRTMTMKTECHPRELSYVRDGLPGLLPLHEDADGFPQRLKDGTAEGVRWMF